MLRCLTLMLACLCPGAVLAETVVPLDIGDTVVRIALPDGYLQASEKAPALFATSAAAMPPAVRLVETLVADADLKRLLGGSDLTEPYLQVQVLRDAEAVRFSPQEWRDLQPTMEQQLGAIDLDQATQALQPGMGERMSAAAGGAIAVRFGAVGKPMLYSREGDAIRYVVRVPIGGTVNGQAKELVLDCASAVFVLDGKLLTFNAYLRPQGEADGMTRVRAFLDTAVARAQALNGPAPPPAPAN